VVWKVTNHETGKSYEEEFTLDQRIGASEQELMEEPR